MNRPSSRTVKTGLLTGFLIVIFHLALSAAVHAQSPDSQVGNVLFKAPEGWQRLEKDGAVVFVPSGPIDQANCFLAILPGQDLEGDFRAWFDAVLGKARTGLRVVKGGEVTATTADEGYPILYTALVTEDSSGQRSYRFYLAAHPGTRAEMFAFVATDPNAYQRYQPVLEAFLKSVDFANRHAQPSEPKKEPAGKAPQTRSSVSDKAGLEGLYVGTESRQQFNAVTKYYDYIVRQVYYLFLPDGRVYYGLPKGGSLSSFSFERVQREDPKNCGYYQISSDRIQFKRPDGSNNQPVAFKRNQDSLQIGRTIYYRVGRFDGLRLDGTYSVRSFTNTSAGSAVGGVSGEKLIAFNRNGRFNEQGFVGYAGSTADVGGTASSRSAGSGTYRISGNTLELAYSDGRRQQYTFFVYPENAKEAQPGLIVIDGTSYLLRK